MLSVKKLRKSFSSERGTVNAVDDISFSVAGGEFFTLLGPSGCGKSTTLRCVAGLERISGGMVEIDGEVVASDSRFVEANRRPISMVFQSYAIWPHMTVLENVMFPLSYRGSGKTGRGERRQRGMQADLFIQLHGRLALDREAWTQALIGRVGVRYDGVEAVIAAGEDAANAADNRADCSATRSVSVDRLTGHRVGRAG